MSLLESLLAFIKTAGSPSEADTTRDGAFSYKSETHAAGLGIAAGWYYGATGQTQLLSLVYAAAVYGRVVGEEGQRRRLIKDVVREPHYALGAVVVGWLLGGFAGYAPV